MNFVHDLRMIPYCICRLLSAQRSHVRRLSWLRHVSGPCLPSEMKIEDVLKATQPSDESGHATNAAAARDSQMTGALSKQLIVAADDEARDCRVHSEIVDRVRTSYAP